MLLPPCGPTGKEKDNKKENHLINQVVYNVGITYFSEVRLRLLPVADKRSKKNLVVVKISEFSSKTNDILGTTLRSDRKRKR